MNRYSELYVECQKRWFNVQFYWTAFSPVSVLFEQWLVWDFSPTVEDIKLSQSRIEEKIQQKPLFYKYYWKPYENI